MFNKILFTINQNTKKILIIATLVAIFVTILTMIPFLVVSTDFSFVQLNFDYISGTKNMGSHVYVYPKTAELDISNVGKTTIGQGGFPLSYFSECALIQRDNNKVYPVCQSMSLGRDSIAPLLMPLLDVFIWTFFFYSFLIFIQALKRKAHRRKIALIFALAIAILVVAVFINDFIGV